MLLGDFDRAQRGEMLGQELAIEQFGPGAPHQHHQPRERDLRGVARRG